MSSMPFLPVPASRRAVPPSVARRMIADAARAMVALLMILSVPTQAQHHVFEPERPGQTWSTEVVAPGWLHVEAGMLLQRASFAPDAGDGVLAGGEVYRHSMLQIPAVMLRMGVSETVEFRAATSYERLSWRYDPRYFLEENEENPAGMVEDSQSGMTVLNLGIKTVVTEEAGWIPRTAFIASLALPGLASPHYDISQPAPDLALSFSHTLGTGLYLGYCGGLSWDGYYANPLGYASTILSMDLGETMLLFAEYGMEVHSHSPVLHSVDAGLIFAAHEHLKLDAWVGFGLGDPDISSPSPSYSSIYRPDFFLGVGGAYRIKL